MKNKINSILIVSFLNLICSLGLITMFKSPDTISLSERRELKSIPKINYKDITSGKYFTDLENALLDQIPYRDTFRTFKSLNLFYLYRQKDNHKVFIKDGYAAQITYPLSNSKIDLLIKKLNYIKDNYFKNASIVDDNSNASGNVDKINNINFYTSIVPDKAYYLVKNNEYLLIDYKYLEDKVASNLPNYISLFSLLNINAYYKTDTHWQNNKLIPVSSKLLEKMQMSNEIKVLNEKTLSPFYGVLYGQSALPLKNDTITYLETDKTIKTKMYRTNLKTGTLEEGKIYVSEYINSNDPYDIFLGGASNVTILDNEEVTNGKTLYFFSDSFGRSLAPLLISKYDKVIIVDLRYIKMSNFVEKYGLNNNSDVLFLYSIQSIDVISNLQVE